MSTIGNRIKAARMQQGLTLSELADIIGESKQTIYKYETGIVTNIPLPKVIAIADALKVSPGYIAGWEEKFKDSESKLSDDEKLLIDLFRLVPDEDRKLVLGMIRAALNSKGLL